MERVQVGSWNFSKEFGKETDTQMLTSASLMDILMAV